MDDLQWLKSLPCSQNSRYWSIKKNIKKIIAKKVINGGLNSETFGYLIEMKDKYIDEDEDNIKEISLFVKRPNFGNASALNVAAFQRWYEREVKFYDLIHPSNPNMITIPKCYLAMHDEKTNNFALILENLLDSSISLEMIDSSPGATFKQAKLCVETIGKFHNTCYSLQKQFVDFLPLMPVHLEFAPNIAMNLQSYWKHVKKSYKSVFDKYESKGIHDISENIENIYVQYTKDLSEEPRTVIHGDYRVGNMMFNKNGKDIVVFDWQFIARGRGVYDLVYFICFDLNVADRRKYENELFHTYLKCLTDAKNVNMSYDMLMDDVKKAVLLIYASLIIGAATSGESGRVTHTLAFHRFVSAIIDWNVVIDDTAGKIIEKNGKNASL